MTPAAFLHLAHRLGRHEAIDRIYATLDERLRAGDFAFVDAVLSVWPTHRPIEQTLSVLTMARLAQKHLRYAEFYRRVRAHFDEYLPERVDDLLRGLAPGDP